MYDVLVEILMFKFKVERISMVVRYEVLRELHSKSSMFDILCIYLTFFFHSKFKLKSFNYLTTLTSFNLKCFKTTKDSIINFQVKIIKKNPHSFQDSIQIERTDCWKPFLTCKGYLPLGWETVNLIL